MSSPAVGFQRLANIDRVLFLVADVTLDGLWGILVRKEYRGPPTGKIKTTFSVENCPHTLNYVGLFGKCGTYSLSK